MKKILIISLLRLGDLILQNEIVRQIKKQYPNSEMHLLLNEQFFGASEVISDIDKFHSFPRKLLQTQLAEDCSSLQGPFDRIRELLNRLNKEKYDLVFNLTHNKLSAILHSMIDAKEKRGALDGGWVYENNWMKYFNNEFSQSEYPPFHWMDILSRAVDISLEKAQIVNSPSKLEKICLQVLTSEEKKNWPLENWQKVINKIEENFPGVQINVLCAGFEAERLDPFFYKYLRICSLAEAKKHLLESDLLISGDTSILHLAASLGIPTLSLYCEDRNRFRAFPRQINARILSAPRIEQISVESVFEELSSYVGRETIARTSFSQVNHSTVCWADGFYFTNNNAGPEAGFPLPDRLLSAIREIISKSDQIKRNVYDAEGKCELT